MENPFADTEAGEVVTTQKFEVGKAKLEVLGVCKVSEDDISCWSPTGVKDPALTERVRKGMEPSSDPRSRSYFVSQYKMKNRLVILRAVSPKGPFEARIGTVQVGSLKTDGERGVAIKGVTDYIASNEVDDSRSARMISETKDTKTVSVRFTYQEPVKDSALLPVKEGEHVTLGGIRFTLAGWKEMPQATWYIQVDTDAKSLKGLNIDFKQLDSEGKLFEFADQDGNPVTQSEYDRVPNDERSFYRTVNSPQILKMGNGFQIRVNVNPKHIGSLSIGGVNSKQGRIDGIALDPK